jgi:ppGpp synthetase/RelA/SpoT-type nucleotidyltranferase
MDQDRLKKDYQFFKEQYQAFQHEIFIFVKNLENENIDTIDFVVIRERPGKKIKELESILNHLMLSNKYQDCKSLFEIKDIAGVRVVCHCEDDRDHFALLLENKLKQKYPYVTREVKGEIKSESDNLKKEGKIESEPDYQDEKREIDSEPDYRAVHINVLKEAKKVNKNIFCEIQIRTVMQDAWAVQSRKYLYKKNSLGEANELSSAVSKIMTGCEKIWSLVKKKSIQEKEIVSSEDAGLKNIQQPLPKSQVIIDWLEENKKHAHAGLSKLGIKTSMEVYIIPIEQKIIPNKDLRDCAQRSTIKTFGWPIGIFSESNDEYAPKDDPNGIHTEISLKQPDWSDPTKEHISYDYWAIHKSASFYLLKSLFEDQRSPAHIFFNTRIVRITEVLMYLENLYKNFNIQQNTIIEISIKHGGLSGRILGSSSSNRELPRTYKIDIDEVQTTIQISLEEIKTSISEIVERFTKPLFEKFESFEISKKALEDIVSNYYRGRVV